jgi:phospholipid/cholesterol/gamma-HCH transport system permease protein
MAMLSTPRSGVWAVTGRWTLSGLGPLIDTLEATRPRGAPRVLDGSRLLALDSTGAWILQRWLRQHPALPVLEGWPERARTLMDAVTLADAPALAHARQAGPIEATGRATLASLRQALEFLGFLGQVSAAAAQGLRRPRAWRVRSVLHEIEIGGFDALPIVGVTSFLLGVVVAYQGADQLRHYGANVFVVELVGYAMLREFAPLIVRHHHRRALGLGLRGAARHHGGGRGDRRAAHPGHRPAAAPGAAQAAGAGRSRCRC